jgi:hypothetical protein
LIYWQFVVNRRIIVLNYTQIITLFYFLGIN